MDRTMGERLKELMAQSNLSQKEITDRLATLPEPVEIDPSYLSRIASDAIDNPHRKILVGLCDVLGSDLEWLVRGRRLFAHRPQIAEVIAHMEASDEELLDWVVSHAARVAAISKELQERDEEIGKLLTTALNNVGIRGIRSRSASVLQKIGS